MSQNTFDEMVDIIRDLAVRYANVRSQGEIACGGLCVFCGNSITLGEAHAATCLFERALALVNTALGGVKRDETGYYRKTTLPDVDIDTNGRSV